jgi:hypothetical protein
MHLEKRVVLNMNRWIHFSAGRKGAAELETLFYHRLHGKIRVLEVFVDGFHAY